MLLLQLCNNVNNLSAEFNKKATATIINSEILPEFGKLSVLKLGKHSIWSQDKLTLVDLTHCFNRLRNGKWPKFTP